ncbi:MAG: DUF1523 family protein, partial [Moraxellaceae bacterium]|nr:DUF1523 family protein [Moraxellaceae bacterium]
MHKLKRLLWIVLAIALIGVGAALHYVLPRHQLVHVIGNEVKLVNTPQTTAPGTAPVTRGQDVFYISTTDLERKNVHVFRNEDTGWGFP